LEQTISITAISSISPLGISSQEIWENYKEKTHCISFEDFNGISTPVSRIPKEAKTFISALKSENSHYKSLDDSVLFGI